MSCQFVAHAQRFVVLVGEILIGHDCPGQLFLASVAFAQENQNEVCRFIVRYGRRVAGRPRRPGGRLWL